MINIKNASIKNNRKRSASRRSMLMKYAAAMMAALILLLTACGQKAEETGVEKNPEMQQNLSAEQKIDQNTEKNEIEETGTENAVPSGELPPWTIYETEEYSIMLVDALDPESGEAMFYITVVNNSDYDIGVLLSDFLLNDEFRTAEAAASSFNDPHEVNSDQLYSFNKWFIQFGDYIGVLKKISFHLEISLSNDTTYEKIDSVEKDCTIVLPDNYETAMIFEPSFSMKAEEQVLFEDEDRLIGLRGLGRSPASTDLYAITGIVHVVNKSDHSIPVECPGLSVNGFYMDPYCYGGGTLPAGSERYMLFQCEKEELELAGIKEITSIELLILTSEEENTGAYNADGGSWYPVSLTETGNGYDDGSEDVLIYEDEIVTVSLSDTWLEWHNVDYRDPYGYYHWILSVNNKSSKNIEFALEDMLIDGVSEDELGWDSYVWPKTSDIGAGARKVVHLQMSTDRDNPVPELSFRIQERTLGGGTLLHYADEHTVIEGGQEKRVDN